MDGPTLKTCSKCGEVQSIGEFYRSAGTKDGFDYWCKRCRKAYNKEAYAKRKAQRKVKEETVYEPVPFDKAEPGYLWCYKCNGYLPPEAFYHGKGYYPYGHSTYCIRHTKEYARNYYAQSKVSDNE